MTKFPATAGAISVIVPACNAETTLGACLDAISASNVPPLETLVVDDGSTDATAKIAEARGARVLRHSASLGTSAARFTGIDAASGSIHVFVDSDILIESDTLAKIREYMATHKNIGGISGRLSRRHLNPNFFSQYKNLYMNFIFDALPEHVDFFYGSIFALRAGIPRPQLALRRFAEDNEWGKSLSRQGFLLGFLRDLEVTHLKNYSFTSWIINDFRVPFLWTHILWSQQGWRTLGRKKSGFLHSPPSQLASLVCVNLSVFAAAAYPWLAVYGTAFASAFLVVWFGLNLRFFAFLLKQRGLLFALQALPVTLLDHFVMSAGVYVGTLAQIIRRHPAQRPA